jgi:hypothetical protein
MWPVCGKNFTLSIVRDKLINVVMSDQYSIDLLPNNQNLSKSRQKVHHSLKEHHKISNIPKFHCEPCEVCRFSVIREFKLCVIRQTAKKNVTISGNKE